MRCWAVASCIQMSRPNSIFVSASVRWTTNTFSTIARPSTAASVIRLSGMRFEPRSPSFAVTITLASASMIRSRSASALKPPKTIEWTAPMRAQASIV